MRFELLEKLGSGTTGTVCKARDLETDEIVALKKLNPDIGFPEREVALARKVTHRNVCRVFELFREEDGVCISMEYIDGESLQSRIQRSGAIPMDEAMRIAHEIIDGLEEAHQQGVVHRDLKPANILITRAGTAKVLDFGLARATDATKTDRISGTPLYMAPEQLMGQLATERSDIYALGLVLQEMISGSCPTLPGAPPLELAVPPYIKDALHRCLQSDPARRFASVTELRNALIIGGQAPPPRRVSSIALAVLVLMVLGLVALALTFPSVQSESTAGPAGPGPVQQSVPVSIPSVAVLPFANLQEDPQFKGLETGIAETLARALERSKRYRVVERLQMQRVFAELNLNQTASIDASTAQQIGKLVGAQYLTIGSFQVFRRQIRINARFVRTETGEILLPDSLTGDVDAALTLTERFAERFLAQ